MIMERFEELKQEILRRAHEARACMEEYGRAYKAETLDDLMQVVRDNFRWCCGNNVLDGALIDAYREEFNAGKIWHNESSITEGLMLMDGSSSGEFHGSSSGVFFDSSQGEFHGSSSGVFHGSSSGVFFGSSSGEFHGSSSGVFHGSSSGEFHGSSRGVFHDNSRGEFHDNSSGEFHGSSSGVFFGSSSGVFYDSSYAVSYSVKECNLHDHALYRIIDLNEVRYADESMKFVKVEEGERWNAEKKVVEDIPKPHEFRKGEPVLVRDGDDDMWEAWVFGRYGRDDELFKYFMIGGPGYLQCIPLNEKTMHLLGTTEDYKEE